MTALRVTIPGAPRGKGRPRFGKTKNGKPITFTDTLTRETEAWIRMCLFDERSKSYEAAEVRDGPLRVRLKFYLPRPKKPRNDRPASRPDLDNLVKTVLDACNHGGVWTDDARVCQLAAEKLYAEPGQERTELLIEAIP